MFMSSGFRIYDLYGTAIPEENFSMPSGLTSVAVDNTNN